MEITYTDKKNFTKEEVQRLFRSVHWVSGEYPERLHKALMHSSTVITATAAGLSASAASSMTASSSPICTMSLLIRSTTGTASPGT